MILYFSGTGNSRYIANRMSKLLEEELLFIPDINPETIEISGKYFGIICPVYSWGIPPLVLDFISGLNEIAVENLKPIRIWTVLTCGDETGNAPKMLEKALYKRGLSLSGGWSIIMPNTYVLLPGFDVDSKEVEMGKLDKAPTETDRIASLIREGKWETDFHLGPWPALKTGLVYPLFRRWGIFPGKWHWTQECVRCGKCASSCPVKNIVMKGGHPKWEKNCVSCLACYHICPAHAIEYGRITSHKGQYFCNRGRKQISDIP